MASPHFFKFSSIEPQISRDGGSRIDVRAAEFTALKRFSLSLLTLEPKALREPHWHPNANELSYCLQGKGLMTIFGPHNDHETFTIDPGEVVYVPRNSLHHIENTGSTPMKLLISFDNENADSSELSSGFQIMPPNVASAVFKQPKEFFAPVEKEKSPVYISMQNKPMQPPFSSIPSPFKFNLEGSNPVLQTLGGWVKITQPLLLPRLKGLSVYSLNLNVKGIREPHWHPNCAELNYVQSGHVRISVMFPGGGHESFELSPGDISYLPEGYLHYIENIGDSDVHMIVFFNNEIPEDIGLSGAAGAYSNEVLSSLFGTSSDYFANFPKFQKNLMIVPGGG